MFTKIDFKKNWLLVLCRKCINELMDELENIESEEMDTFWATDSK